ncbi:glycosyltransferase [Spirosoma sp.]|uniref:glycosyltransferase n=1 Tax=Spirosoma sp. TaxID=1899569 RepID=UPI002631E5AC|nr:glycosyltransferase [Spirosoma sp.]MCX6212993.1 glycosyltransferase [Spirosoma sp.]
MKKVVMITDVDFWQGGAGHRSRISELARYLHKFTQLTILLVNQPKNANLELKHGYLNIIEVKDLLKLKRSNQQLIMAQIIQSLNCDCCLVEYIHLSYLIDTLPPQIKRILDTHDIISQRKESFNKAGYVDYYHLPISFDEEIEIYKRYDNILLIQDQDYCTITPLLETGRTLLVPHAVSLERKNVATNAYSVSFVGSTYVPNVDGIHWFLDKVWPRIADNKPLLHLFGNVSQFVSPTHRVIKRGFYPDLNSIYQQVDIAINPVQFGSGLKIKNVEALSAGLPLITMKHGLSGLEDAQGTALIAVDNEDEFVEELTDLLGDYNRRVRLSQNAYDYALTKFSPQACYLPLLNVINQ